jgi:hypothetical protein
MENRAALMRPDSSRRTRTTSAPRLHHPNVSADGSVQSRPGPLEPFVRPANARGAVIIPAHDEAAVIGRTLTSLTPLTDLARVEVIVVCNGCADDTASVARSFDGVRVEEVEKGSKALALNVGDCVATEWPRLYLDADIEVSSATVLAIFDRLAEPGVLAARAHYVYDCTGATWPVRSYYRARSRVPAPALRLWGAGGYATNEVGHARFTTFPTVTADDSWFDAQFADAEKSIVAAAPMRVRTPRDLKGLFAILARQRRGYVELGFSSHAGPRLRGLMTGVRGPRSATDVLWYATLSVLARRRAARALRGGDDRAWERDRSSRNIVEKSR